MTFSYELGRPSLHFVKITLQNSPIPGRIARERHARSLRNRIRRIGNEIGIDVRKIRVPCSPASAPEKGSSPAGDAHVAGERRAPMAPVDDEVVTPGLARDRFIDGGIEQVIGFGRPQHAAQLTASRIACTMAGCSGS
jgi:hypothetical protein